MIMRTKTLLKACLIALVPSFSTGAEVLELVPDSVPDLAIAHQRTLTKAAHAHWGLNAPIALFAGQIHQESSWRIDARSQAGAQGLVQFMPATSEWFARLHPVDLGGISKTAQPFNPTWAISALVLYDRHLYKQVKARSPCNSWAFTLSAYNGGYTWVERDQNLASASGADPLVWFDATERFNAGRSNVNFRENRHYPKKIIHELQHIYIAAGWGLGVCYDF